MVSCFSRIRSGTDRFVSPFVAGIFSISRSGKSSGHGSFDGDEIGRVGVRSVMEKAERGHGRGGCGQRDVRTAKWRSLVTLRPEVVGLEKRFIWVNIICVHFIPKATSLTYRRCLGWFNEVILPNYYVGSIKYALQTCIETDDNLSFVTSI